MNLLTGESDRGRNTRVEDAGTAIIPWYSGSLLVRLSLRAFGPASDSLGKVILYKKDCDAKLVTCPVAMTKYQGILKHRFILPRSSRVRHGEAVSLTEK